MMIIDGWLEDKISERRFHFGQAANPNEYAMFAGMLRAEALFSGYSADALEDACEGDICSYISRRMVPPAIHPSTIPNVSPIDPAVHQ